MFAKLGSDMKKPDAVTVIPKDNFRDIIWDLPASDMLGVGRSTEKFLSSYGIHTIGQLANAYPDLMQRKLGKNGNRRVQRNLGVLTPMEKHEQHLMAA